MSTKTDLLSRTRFGAAAALSALALSLGACASGLGSNDYSRGQVGQITRVDPGTIISVEQVKIEGTKSGVGVATGAALGGLAGSQIGGGDEERIAAGIAGAVLGGLAGSAVEEGMNSQTGWRYLVRNERTGETVAIVQAGQTYLPPGLPVYIEYGARARVIPQNPNFGVPQPGYRGY